MKKLRRGVKLYLLAMAAAASSILSAATFANYYSEGVIQGKLSVAKWEFDAKLDAGGSGVVDLQLQDIKGLSAASTISPGSSGSFDIRLFKGSSNIKQIYKIKTIRSSLPDNLKLYTDNACTKELTDSMEFDDSLVTLTVYWKWNYTTVNENVWQKKGISAKLLVQAYQKV